MTSHSRITTNIDEAVKVLLEGGVVGMPTETVYGLAALALNSQAVKRVFDIKNRPYRHPLIVHVANSEEAKKWGKFNDHATQLSRAFWPGPLTLLLPRTSLVPDWITGGRDTVAIRVPSHPVTQELLTRVGHGVVAPSANKFGKVSPVLAAHVIHDLGNEVDLVLDGGECAVGVESTIVECIGDAVQILRHGGITREQIENELQFTLSNADGESRAPGMLQSHYSPHAHVLLFETKQEAEQASTDFLETNHTSRVLSHEDPYVYAQRLYQDLRQADIDNIDIICAVLPAIGGIGDAIRDRLRKAAAD